MNTLTAKCTIDDLNVDIDFDYDQEIDSYSVVGVRTECGHDINLNEAYELLLDEIQARSEQKFEERWER
jgi:hypothetical protein